MSSTGTGALFSLSAGISNQSSAESTFPASIEATPLASTVQSERAPGGISNGDSLLAAPASPVKSGTGPFTGLIRRPRPVMHDASSLTRSFESLVNEILTGSARPAIRIPLPASIATRIGESAGFDDGRNVGIAASPAAANA